MADCCYALYFSCAAQQIGPPDQSSYYRREGTLLGIAQTPKLMAPPLLRPPPGPHEMQQQCLRNSMPVAAWKMGRRGHLGQAWGPSTLYKPLACAMKPHLMLAALSGEHAGLLYSKPHRQSGGVRMHVCVALVCDCQAPTHQAAQIRGSLHMQSYHWWVKGTSL